MLMEIRWSHPPGERHLQAQAVANKLGTLAIGTDQLVEETIG